MVRTAVCWEKRAIRAEQAALAQASGTHARLADGIFGDANGAEHGRIADLRLVMDPLRRTQLRVEVGNRGCK